MEYKLILKETAQKPRLIGRGGDYVLMGLMHSLGTTDQREGAYVRYLSSHRLASVYEGGTTKTYIITEG